MDLRPPLRIALRVFGVPATVEVAGQTPVETSVIWILTQMDRAPAGSEFQRIEPVRIAVVDKTAVPTLPRGSVIDAPERAGDTVASWEVDGPWATDPTVHPDEHRVLVLPKMAVPT